MTWHQTTSHDITSHLATNHIASRHLTVNYIASSHLATNLMTSYHVTSQHIASLLRKHKQPPPKRRHQTERLKAGEHKKFGLGSAPVVRPAHVVWANSFFGLYGSSLWNFRARLARELLISRVYIIKLIKANLVTAVFNVLLSWINFWQKTVSSACHCTSLILEKAETETAQTWSLTSTLSLQLLSLLSFLFTQRSSPFVACFPCS